MRTFWISLGMVMWLGFPTPVWAQAAGQTDISTCTACHSEGEQNSAKLGGQDPAYLVKQLREYRSGKRKGDIMAQAAGDLKKREIPALAAGLAKQVSAPGKVDNEQLAARGKALYEGGNPATGVAGCVGCHLPNGVGNQRYPGLAGQVQAYTVQQLTDFKTGARNNDKARVMRNLAERMTEEEMKAVAEYAAGLSGAR